MKKMKKRKVKKIASDLSRDYFDKRFDKQDKRFNEHDKRFDKLTKAMTEGFRRHDKKFEEHDKRFDKQDKRFDEHDKRFDKQDKEISDIKTGLFSVKYDLKELSSTVAEIKDGQGEMMSLLDGYVKSNEDFKEEFYIMRTEVGEIKKVIKEKLGVEISLI